MSRVPKDEVWQLLKARWKRIVKNARRAGISGDVACNQPACNELETPNAALYLGLNYNLFCEPCLDAAKEEDKVHIWRTPQR